METPWQNPCFSDCKGAERTPDLDCGFLGALCNVKCWLLTLTLFLHLRAEQRLLRDAPGPPCAGGEFVKGTPPPTPTPHPGDPRPGIFLQ